MNKILGLLLSLFYLSISAQSNSVSLQYATLLDSSILKSNLQVLANDSLLGRETGMEGQKRAEKYIVSVLKEYAIQPAVDGEYTQLFNVVTNKLNSVSLSVDDSLINNENAIFSTSFIQDTTFLSKDIIFAGYGIASDSYNDYSGISVKGKLVFILEDLPLDKEGNSIFSEEEEKIWKYNFILRSKVADDYGALGLVVVSTKNTRRRTQFLRYYDYRDISLLADATVAPSFFMSEEVFHYIFYCDSKDVDDYLLKKRMSKKKFDISKELKFSIKSNREIMESSNVIGKIESINTLAPWIVLTAHYDHVGFNDSLVYNGADDNGSGTSAILNIAKVFSEAKEDGISFDKNILFMLVSGEEKGLLGSKYYVSNPIVDLNNTLCNLNIDMIGRVDKKHIENENYIYLIGSDRISKDLHDINENMNQLYTHLDLDYTYNALDDPQKYYERSDHYNFAKNGIPVIFYFNGSHADYHKASDTEEKITYSALLKRTQLVFHTAWYLATMEAMELN